MDRKPRNLATLSKEEMKLFLKSFDMIISDCDGVVWMPGGNVPRCDLAIKKLRDLGKKIIFFSNNSITTRNDYIKKFAKHGIDIDKSEIVLPSIVVADYLKTKNIQKKVYLVGSDASQKEIESFGLSVHREPGILQDASILELLNNVTDMDPEVGAVVMDIDVNISYLKMMKAVAYLKDPDCLFVVTATERNIPFAGSLTFIGPGYFCDVVKAVSSRDYAVMGKPSVLAGEYFKRTYSVDPKRTLMIGDTLSHDIGFASNCGFQSLMVLSGVNKLEDIGEESVVPDYYISSLRDLAPLLP